MEVTGVEPEPVFYQPPVIKKPHPNFFIKCYDRLNMRRPSPANRKFSVGPVAIDKKYTEVLIPRDMILTDTFIIADDLKVNMEKEITYIAIVSENGETVLSNDYFDFELRRLQRSGIEKESHMLHIGLFFALYHLDGISTYNLKEDLSMVIKFANEPPKCNLYLGGCVIPDTDTINFCRLTSNGIGFRHTITETLDKKMQHTLPLPPYFFEKVSFVCYDKENKPVDGVSKVRINYDKYHAMEYTRDHMLKIDYIMRARTIPKQPVYTISFSSSSASTEEYLCGKDANMVLYFNQPVSRVEIVAGILSDITYEMGYVKNTPVEFKSNDNFINHAPDIMPHEFSQPYKGYSNSHGPVPQPPEEMMLPSAMNDPTFEKAMAHKPFLSNNNYLDVAPKQYQPSHPKMLPHCNADNCLYESEIVCNNQGVCTRIDAMCERIDKPAPHVNSWKTGEPLMINNSKQVVSEIDADDEEPDLIVGDDDDDDADFDIQAALEKDATMKHPEKMKVESHPQIKESGGNVTTEYHDVC